MSRPRRTNNSAQTAFNTPPSPPVIVNNNNNNPLPVMNNINVITYHGGYDNLEFFIHQIEDLKTNRHISDNEALSIAFKHMAGPAIALVTQRFNAQHRITSTAQLFQLLRQNFRPPSDIQNRNDFNKFQMLPGESIISLSNRLDEVVTRAFRILHPPSLEEIKFNKLMQVIPANCRIFLEQNGIRTYQEAVDRAATFLECQNNEFVNHQNIQQDRIAQCEKQINFVSKQIEDLNHHSTISQVNKQNTSNRKHDNYRKPVNLQSNNKFRHYHNRNTKFSQKRKFNPYRNTRDKAYYRPQNKFNTHEHTNFYQRSQCQMCGQFGHVLKDCLLFKNAFVPRSFNNQNSTSAITEVPATSTINAPNFLPNWVRE